MKHNRLMKNVAPKNETELTKNNAHAFNNDIVPAGRCRCAVLGFNASKRRSMIRLNVIALVRAVTIAQRIRRKIRQPGQPPRSRAATTIAASAKGKAKTVWEILIKSPHLFAVAKKLIHQNLTSHPALIQPSGRRQSSQSPSALWRYASSGLAPIR